MCRQFLFYGNRRLFLLWTWVSKVSVKFMTWQNAQIKLFAFRCANRSEEPLKIVFSKGFRDF